jgi:hypothetical protein
LAFSKPATPNAAIKKNRRALDDEFSGFMLLGPEARTV